MPRWLTAWALLLALCITGSVRAEASADSHLVRLVADPQQQTHTFFTTYWPWLSSILDAGLVLSVLVLWRMRKKNRLLQRALDQASDGVYLIDERARLLYVNDAACRALGYSREALLGMGVEDIDHSASLDAALAVRKKTQEGGAFVFETQHRRRDGSLFPVEVQVSAVWHDGRLSILALARDISERKQAERERLLLQRALSQTSEAMYIQDASLRFVDVNDTACRMLGYSREELLALRPTDIAPDVTDEAITQAFQTEELGKPHIFESRHRSKDGRIFPVELSGVFFEDGGVLYAVTMVRDISERKRMEERLVESEFKFRSLAEHAPDNIIRYDRQFRFLYCNPQAERTMGRTLGELVGKVSSEVFSHGEYDEVGALLKRTLAGKQEMEHVLATPDDGNGGRVHHLRCVPEFGEDGEVVSLLLFGRDMTDVYRMQETIAARERDYRILAENIPDNVARWDSEGRFLFSNPTHQQTLGKSLDEMLGKTHAEIFPDGRFASFDETLFQAVASGKEVRITRVPVPAADGGTDIHDVRLTPEFDDGGKVVSVLGLGRNMTEIYRMQEAIAEREQAFRSLAENSPDFIVRYDRAGRRSYLNSALVKQLGLTSAVQSQGKRPSESWPDGRFEPLEQAAARVVESGQIEMVELSMRSASGNMIEYHQILVAPERAVRGEIIGTIAFGRDVTAIREQELMLKHFIDRLPGMAFTFQRMAGGSARFAYVSPDIEHFFGLAPHDVATDFSPFRKLIHPDDVQKVDAAMAASAETLTPFQIELRVCRPGFPLRWLDVRAMPGQQDDGGILWYGIMLDITARKLAELALDASREQLRGLIVQREKAREEERKYIAREIHDDLGQILTGVKMGMSVIEMEVGAAGQAQQRVAEVKALTETAIKVMRDISSAIRPVELEMGIAAALRWQAQRFGTFSGVACMVEVRDGADSLDETQSAAVFRLVQEALTNVARHAKAQHVQISLGLAHEEVVLRIEDDGCGFDPAAQKAGSFGLVGMQERARMLGGVLSIDSRAHGGMRLEVRFPLHREQETA